MELVLLALIIITFTGYAYKVTVSDAKMIGFDTYNLALFMERTPSIEGNFKYVFQFNKSVDIDFQKDTIQLDKSPSLTDKKYAARYANPKNFQIEAKFQNVSKLYFYKIGTQLYASDKPKEDLESRLTDKEITNNDGNAVNTNTDNFKQTKIFFYTNSTNNLQYKSAMNFLLKNKNINTESQITKALENMSSLIWIQIDSKENSFEIEYNDKAKTYGDIYYNQIKATSTKNKLGEVNSIPITNYDEIISALQSVQIIVTKEQLEKNPIIITKTNKFGEYVQGLN